MPTYRAPGSKRWRYRGTVNGQRFSGSTPVGDNTQRCAADLERAHIKRLVSGLAAPLTLRDWLTDHYLPHQKARVGQLTYKGLVSIVTAHLIPALGSRLLSQIDRAAIDAMVTSWSCMTSTINRRLTTLHGALALAVEHKRLAALPAIRKGKVPRGTIRFLSDMECAALLAVAPAEWRTMVLVAMRTGLRIGELRGLHWEDVDHQRGEIRVRRTDPGVGGMKSNEPKGRKHRTVPLTSDAFMALSDSLDRMTGPVWPSFDSRRRRSGRSRSESCCAKAMERMTAAAGIQTCSWHTLRHTYASHLVMRGVPLRVVQALLGHSSITQTEAYAHLAPDFAFHDAVRTLDTPMLAVGETKQLTERT